MSVEALTAGCGCHGCRVEIPGLLARLDATEEALREARPYVFGVASDSTYSGWRRETAKDILSRVDAALAVPATAKEPT